MIVLDTHIWIWWVNRQHERLPASILSALSSEARVGVSAMSCLEVARLVRGQRIQLHQPLATWFKGALSGADVELLPITPEIAELAANLPFHHKDPSDRAIIATALHYGAKLASLDGFFREYVEVADYLLN